MKTRVLSVMLAVLTAMLLCSCAKSGSVSSADGQSMPFNSTQSEQTESTSQVDINAVLDYCGRMADSGKFYSKFTVNGNEKSVNPDDKSVMRNGIGSACVTLSGNLPELLYDVDSVSDNVGVYVFAAPENLGAFRSCGVTVSLKTVGSDGKTGQYSEFTNGMINAGWNFLKVPLAEMKGKDTAVDKVMVAFNRRNKENDVILYVNGVVCDSKMKPAAIISFDGIYATDAEAGGKFELLRQHNIPFTVFCNSNIATSTAVFGQYKELQDAGLGELQLYGCRDINGLAAKYGLQDVCKATLDETTVDPVDQFTMIEYASKMLKQDLNPDAFCYAAKQGKLTGTTYGTLHTLGYKLARVTAGKYIGVFSENDFTIGMNGYYKTTDMNDIYKLIDSAVAHGCTVSLFTHEVTDAGTDWGATKEQFATLVQYLAEKRDAGELELLSCGQFYKGCIEK